MELVIISSVAFIVAGITLFSGFGLGTILMPVFAVFFPVNIAIALTAVVHLINSIFRTIILARSADKNILLKFGVPAIFAAILGAYVLSIVSGLDFLVKYQVLGHEFEVLPVKFIIGVLIMVFVLLELTNSTKKITFDEKYLPLGGILSGFFGGLSGHQGVFRSAFLLQANLSEKAFIASNTVIAVMVDIIRLIVYGISFSTVEIINKFPVLLAASVAAIGGSLIGILFIKKVTIKIIRIIVAIMLFGIAVALLTGTA